MSDVKHTAGELGFYYIPRSDLNPHGTYAIVAAEDLKVPPSQRYHMAEITGFGDGSPLRRKVPDHVHLFVSAPDLLEALKALVAEEWSEMDDDDLQYELSQGNEMVRPYIAARAAIAKATNPTS